MYKHYIILRIFFRKWKTCHLTYLTFQIKISLTNKSPYLSEIILSPFTFSTISRDFFVKFTVKQNNYNKFKLLKSPKMRRHLFIVG